MWRAGDKVRIGAHRGGVVFEDRPGTPWLVRWPSSRAGAPVTWLDHCVPDEGPDGPIDSNTWTRCEGCENPSISLWCVNCTARQAAEVKPPAPLRGQLRIASPPIGVHMAGAPGVLEDYPGVKIQACARCGAPLKCIPDVEAGVTPPDTLPAGDFYQVGALIERGRGWQAYNLWATEPNCEIRRREEAPAP
jgi:hypothetical protein